MSLPDSFDDSFALFRLVEVHLERVVCAPAWQPCGNDLGGEAVYRVEFLLGLYRGAGHSGEFREQLFRGDWEAVVKYLVPVLSFLLGIAVAELVHVHYRKQEKIHWRQIVLIEEILLLFIVGFIPETLDPLANALVSFVCALQVQTFHKIHGQPYASTMCIGNMRSGMESLVAYFRSRDHETLVKSLTYFGVIGVFAAGAGIGSVLSQTIGHGIIWVCCGLLSVSFFLMFIHEKQEQ